MNRQQRTQEQLKEHYEIEKQLAEKLCSVTWQERQKLYGAVYDELFKRVLHHPQLTRKSSPSQTAQRVNHAMRYLRPFLKDSATFLEIGAGDCALSFAVARLVNNVIALDVSNEISRNAAPPPNFTLVLSEGRNIPLPKNSVTVAYSNQLMEHLHPEDALEQLRGIYNALISGGIYICITPNALNGPHDISRRFDPVATGFHLKEYTVAELRRLFKATGFSTIKVFIVIKNYSFFAPLWLVEFCETLLSMMHHSARKSIGSTWAVAKLLGINMVGTK